MPPAPAPLAEGPLGKNPRALMVGYALPAFALKGILMLLGTFLLRLYAEDYGLSLAMLSRIAVVASVADAVSAPIFGGLSDRAVRRGFSRGAFAFLGSLPLALALLMVFAPPAGVLGHAKLGIWCLLAVVALHLATTSVEVPHNALGTEVTEDYDARNQLVAARECVGIIGSVVAALLPTFLSQFGNKVAFKCIAIVFGLVAVGGMGACKFATDRFRADSRPGRVPAKTAFCSPPAPAAKNPKPVTGTFLPLIRRLLFESSGAPARALLFTQAFSYLGVAMNAATFPFFVPHVLLQPGSLAVDPVGIMLGAYISVAVACLPLWLRLGERVEKHHALVLASVLQGTGFLATAIFCGRGADGRGGLIPFIIFGLMSGIGMAGTLIFPPSMRADVCTEDEYRTGLRREGNIEGLYGLVTRACGTLGVVCMLAGLGAGGFQEGVGTAEQTLQARLAIRFLYGAVPGAIVLLATLPLLHGYSLNRAAQTRLVRLVQARRQVVQSM